MDYSPKVAEQIEKLPPDLRKLFDAEIAAGNDVYSIEFGRGEDNGKVALILNHPFRTKPADAPAGVLYREFLDRDPQMWEFYNAQGMFSLVTAKFKPVKLEPLGPGPENPNEKHAKEMKKRHKELAADAKKRAREGKRLVKKKRAADEVTEIPPERLQFMPPPPIPPAPRPPQIIELAKMSEAANKFLASMNITYDMWHDGMGYDLDALKLVTDAERKSIESILIYHSPRDWRDIEALAQFDTPQSKEVVERALHSSDQYIRQTAMNYAGPKLDPRDRERLLIQSLTNDNLYGGLSQAIDEAEEFHPPKVIDALLKGALNRDGEAAVHFVALLFYLHGKAKEAFDWDHRPFYLKFHTTDRKERIALFKEMCETIGVDWAKYVR